MKILLLSSSMRCGGAERVLSMLANYWAETGHDIVLVTLDRGELSFFPLSEKIERIGLLSTLNESSLRILRKIKGLWQLRKIIKSKSPDIIISFQHLVNVTAIVSSAFLHIPVIVSERNTLNRDLPSHIPFLVKKFYPFASAVVVQTDRVGDWFRQNRIKCKIELIENPVVMNEKEKILDHPTIVIKKPAIVALGSLTQQKGFDRLIQIFYSASKSHPDAHLYIIGEGTKRNTLEKLTEELGIKDKVFLTGYVESPERLLKEADVFAFTSYYEGFPNALLEAMCLGLPVISFDVESGPAEMILDMENGVLVRDGDIEKYAEMLNMLLEDKNLRKKLGHKACKLKEKYNIKNIASKWENLMGSIIEDNR